jgi:hypothetical protein
MSKIDSDHNWAIIKGHPTKPEEYLLVNAKELEELKLVDLRHKDVLELKKDIAGLKTDLADFKTDVADLKSNVSKILEILT